VSTWLGNYEAGTPGVEGGDNSSVRLDDENEPQPDCFLRLETERGGRSRTSEDDIVEGAPELVFEVASSSASYDLHQKLGAYRRHGVLEYVVWRVRDRKVDWFVLEGNDYKRREPESPGLHRSREFPGLWLDPAALIRGDLPRLLAVLDEGLRSPEHASFVERLRGASPAQ
jgi:Uma2 family endonuclease